MSGRRAPYFSLQDLLVIAALAALGGMSGSVVSMVGKVISGVTGMPVQFMAGIHVLWLILALGLLRRPGAATATALLKGGVELLTGNPHGLLVVPVCLVAGLVVDVIWLLALRRHHIVVYAVAGGAAAASNVFVFALATSLLQHRLVQIGVAITAVMAFAGGVLLAGILGWWLLGVLRLAGIGPPSSARRVLTPSSGADNISAG